MQTDRSSLAAFAFALALVAAFVLASLPVDARAGVNGTTDLVLDLLPATRR